MPKLSQHRDRVVDMFQAHGTLTTREVADKLGCSVAHAAILLNELGLKVGRDGRSIVFRARDDIVAIAEAKRAAVGPHPGSMRSLRSANGTARQVPRGEIHAAVAEVAARTATALNWLAAALQVNSQVTLDVVREQVEREVEGLNALARRLDSTR